MSDPASDDALAATGLAATRDSATRLPHGGALGRYVIKDVLGSGGMGVVYRAHDPELGRLVALKVVRPGKGEGTKSESRGRLVREAQAMARVAHPNVIVVHDAGSIGDDVFVAMELVDGEDLGSWQTTPHPWREVVDVYLQAARGLAAAHRAGLVHRDFKPANTLVGRDGRVRVLDFGLARTLDGDSLAETAPAGAGVAVTALTQTGAVMGTPQFMSPEQHLGKLADARSDQFSLCVAVPDPIGNLYHSAFSPEGARMASNLPGANGSGALVIVQPPGIEPLTLSSTSAAIPLGWSKDGAWVYSLEQPTDDYRLRLIATSTVGDGASRLIAVLEEGEHPILVDDDAAAIFNVTTTVSDIWMASIDARPTLPPMPPGPPPPPVTPRAMHATPQNLALAGEPNTIPAGWEVSGEPRPAVLATECGPAATCVLLDGRSAASVFQRIDAAPYRGKRVKLSVDAKVDTGATLMVGIDSGIYARSEIPSGQLKILPQRWERRELLADVAPDAIYIEIKAKAVDGGLARVANFALEPVEASR
ncbi:MAG: serine/threonine protein kinase [Deltaproteobacteria bacterium]|nr:serine/threonine protein kinase [Deltaproteobacteria bacterium]MDQ3298574.1 serine/threonine protein kinase [Myxococcota bacterium]